MPWLKNSFPKGGGLIHVPHEWFEMVANFINGLEYEGGKIERTGDLTRCRIIPVEQDAVGDAAAFSFQVTRVGDTTVNVASGFCQYAAESEVSKTAIQLTTTASGEVYIKLDLLTGSWDDATFATSMPADTSTLTYYRIASVTVASGVITGIVQRHLGDLYEGRV